MFTEFTNDDLFIARKLFQLEVYKKNGKEFEDFFSKIMRLNNIEFEQVKPQGRYGDRKNDGFIKSSGSYYQVYAPEDATIKEKETIDKLNEDFEGLYNYWNTNYVAIKEFSFVLNDKYNGGYASLHTELKKIEDKYPSVTCKSFLSQHLEDIFLKLPRHHIEDIIGRIPSAEDIQMNTSVLNEVVEYLAKIPAAYKIDSFPQNPDFDEKIVFNSLSEPASNFLKYGSYQDGALKDYFKYNSTFSKDNLKQIFSNLYQEGKNTFPDTENKSDLIFFHILHNSYPSQTKVYQDQIFALMAYFFGYCDIFEEPPVNKQIQLF